MSAHPLLALALAASLAAPLRLFPPGWSAKPHRVDTSRLQIPPALAGGPRGGGFLPGVSFPMRATVGPSPARLGQQLTYRAHVIVTDGARASFAPPAPGGNFTWGVPKAGRVSVARGASSVDFWNADSVWLEIPLQVFATGPVSIPGPTVTIRPAKGNPRPVVSPLPTVHLLVLPTVTAADSNATLRPVHGPLGAPWWERVAWRIVAAAVAALALLAWLVVAIARRRKPAPAAAARAVAPVRRDPGAEALAALAKLRAERLPEQERFGEHALALTRILRRYLEATLVTPRPGDTSGELLARLRAVGLAAEDVQRLEGLLGLWDRVKFARAPLSLPEAQRCESAVEQLVRRRDRPQEVA